MPIVDPLTGIVLEPGMDVVSLPSLGTGESAVEEGGAGGDAGA